MYIDTFHGSISVTQRQMDVEEVINTQIYTILTMETTKNISKNINGDHLYTKNSYRVKEV